MVEQAYEWAQALKIKESEVIVLGLGAGFHVEEILKLPHVKKVHILDSRVQLKFAFEEQFKHLLNKVSITILESPQALLEHELFYLAAKNALSTLCFQPSWGDQADLFEHFYLNLTGRTRNALEKILKFYGHSLEISEVIQDTNKVLSIKDLSLVVDMNPSLYPQFSAVKVLRELVI